MDDIIKIEPNELRTEMQKLRAEGYDFMRSLTGMDWGEEGLGVVYHLEKTATGENKVIKAVTANREKAELPTVCDIWKVCASPYCRTGLMQSNGRPGV